MNESSAADILVVLPTLGDRLTYLERTLESVASQREDVSLTLVVVLPPEATEARALAALYGARVVDDPRMGISRAINAGIESADGEQYYAWIGDDDLFRSRGLLRLQELMAAHDSAVVAYGACDYVDSAGRTLFTNRAGRLGTWLLPWGPDLVPHPGSLIRIEAIRRVGLFDTRLKYAMDLDMFLRLRHHGRFVSTRQTVSAFRWHNESLTVSNRTASSREAEVIKTRHLPRALRPLSPVWNLPVRWASARAAHSVSRKAASVRFSSTS